MHDLDRSIIATLGYYGVFGRPLTVIDLSDRLIPASRLGGRRSVSSISDILKRLDVLKAIGIVIHDSGLYTLMGTAPGFAERRIEQEKVWTQKWRRMLRRAFWLQVVPYVKALYASGSMALGTTSLASDWDIFTIVKTRRLYTARLGLLAAAWLLGSLRRKYDINVSDKFCFNHYVSTDGLMGRHRSLYTAHVLYSLIPIFECENYWSRFDQANHWIDDYCPSSHRAAYACHSINSSAMLNGLRRAMELLLDTYIGTILERVLRFWQQRRIRLESATYERGGRVIADEYEIEFHPRSFEVAAINGYNSVLDRYGLGAYAEHDSGLN